MERQKPTTPEGYAGVFQSYDDIPERYRLETFASQYEGEATWQQYVDNVLFNEYDVPSRTLRSTTRSAGNSWRTHMAERGRHHALAAPVDVEAWCQQLLELDLSHHTCYAHYFVRIYRFYEYLMNSYQHPHLYNPMLLAAIEHEGAHHIWEYRLTRTRGDQQ